MINIVDTMQVLFACLVNESMTGFVTWPPLLYQDYYKGGQVTNQSYL